MEPTDSSADTIGLVVALLIYGIPFALFVVAGEMALPLRPDALPPQLEEAPEPALYLRLLLGKAPRRVAPRQDPPLRRIGQAVDPGRARHGVDDEPLRPAHHPHGMAPPNGLQGLKVPFVVVVAVEDDHRRDLGECPYEGEERRPLGGGRAVGHRAPVDVSGDEDEVGALLGEAREDEAENDLLVGEAGALGDVEVGDVGDLHGLSSTKRGRVMHRPITAGISIKSSDGTQSKARAWSCRTGGSPAAFQV